MAHYNTLFNSLLQVIPGHFFKKLESAHNSGRKPRIFTFRQQFIVMAFMQLANRRSLRNACVAWWPLKTVCIIGG